MSLKRKASFTALPTSLSVPAPNEWVMGIGSTHLHSRTRKRFRDDRPSDQVIYQNTLRWIFSAQKQQESTQANDMDTMDSEPTLETPEAVDPRQQTLHRFFQQKPQQSSSFRPSPQALAPRANETAHTQEDLLRRQAFNQMSSGDTSSESNSPGSNQMADVDMDMDMDSTSGSDGVNQMPKNWVGGMAWR
ncbi:hypothetical protein N7491_007303 [Penicillium cf. griseofulvum]|uniref:Uncharacterized protein n=1 Tax=Penicillium cf. griseofulvum TaxID=2972120 RepID=A0A9W9ITI3_9EURO|nr:hypothetical protein N7472_009668 [Penicillium cf. griseofulvum]KAJ5430287.1 hypothetical protein N7491_007303 [Penicillium cf. griseofulvum]KAJ5435943.1 hypothetical protein N7445_006828 [Penicillium cf. griseofulvum]